MGSPIVFGLLAAVALASAMGMLLSRNAIHSALYLVLNFSTIAVFFLLLNAPFLFVAQIIIYAGAIMVLFLFVVMLLGADRLVGSRNEAGKWQLPFSLTLAFLLIATFVYVLTSGDENLGESSSTAVTGGPVEIGLALFESYVFPFEVASVLLLVAMVGVVVLRTKRGGNA